MDINILQNRWLILAFFGGLSLILAVVLAYMAYYRPRPAGGQEQAPPPAWWRLMPWVLVLIAAGVIIWGLLYTYAWSVTPPNW